MIANYQFSRKIAFLMFKLLPNIKVMTKNVMVKMKQKQMKLLWNIIAKKYFKKINEALNHIKVINWNLKFKAELVARQIITFSKLRK